MIKFPDTKNIDEIVDWCSNYGWMQSAGVEIPLRQMRLTHLLNILKYLEAHPSISQNVKKRFTEIRPLIFIELLRRTCEKLHN